MKSLAVFLMFFYSVPSFSQFQLAIETPPAAPPAAVAPAPLSDRVTVNGSFRLRNETDSDTDYSSFRSFSAMRMRADVNVKVPEENLRLFFQPQYTKNFGEPALAPATTTTNANQNTSGTTVDPSFSVHQAYMEYSLQDWSKLTAGRQVFSYGDELVIGALEWNTVGRSFDGAKARGIYSFGWTDFFYSKLVENNTTSTSTGGDIGFGGVYTSLNMGDFAKAIDLYYLQREDDSLIPGKRLYAWGARAASPVNSFDYRLEYTREWGNSVIDSEGAYQADAEIGYKIFEDGIKPRISAEAFEAGKDYDQLYPTTHKWLGFADIFGRRNIKGAAAHFSFVPVEAWTALIDYHYFTRTDSEGPAYKVNGTTALGSPTALESKELGNEIDLTLKYKVSKGLGLSGGYSFFNAGDFLKDQFPNRTPEFYFVQAEASF